MNDRDDGDFDEDEWMLPPRRRDGSFAVYEFEGADDRLPEVLETIAAWLRECAEYLLEQDRTLKRTTIIARTPSDHRRPKR